MRIQFPKTSALVITLLGLTSSPLFAQLSVPEEYVTTTFSGTKGNLMVSAHKMPIGPDGFTQLVRGLGDNSVAAAETELQDGFLDPVTGQPVVSDVNTTPLEIAGVVNFTQSPMDAGYFNANNPDVNGQISDITPMPASVDGTEYALQFYGYAELPVGAYRMFVNSDDGFKLSFGPNALDVLGVRAGAFDGGRGHTLDADPTAGGFDFVITRAGVYPFRLIFEQGGGDANIEWYMLGSNSNRVLINDTAAPVKTYPNGRGRAYLKKFLPYPGSNGVVPRPTLTFQVVDDQTTVADDTIKVILDGTDISSSVSKVRNGGTLTVTWTPAADYPLESQHTGQFIYTENNGMSRTNDISFTIKGFLPGDLPANSFWIEVEDFDFDHGKYLPVADTAIGTDPAPYTGGAYLNLLDEGHLGAVLDIDYHKVIGPTNDDGSLGGYVYRTDIPGWLDPPDNTRPGYFVPLGGKTDAGVANTRPGGVTITVNYNTAWSESSWYNFTRTIPNGTYNVFLAACHWNDTDDPADGQIDSTLHKVTAGVGTANQTLQRLGSFYGPANRLTETLTTLKGSDGTPAVVKFNGKTTLRLSVSAGDSDYLTLAPVSGIPARITDATPANGATVGRTSPISVRIEDFSTTVTLNTVRLILDGLDVTANANPSKPADITTMSYLPAGGWTANSTHTYIVQFTDSATKTTSVTNTFNVNALGAAGQFVIEAEDFNYGGGQTKPAASNMPYRTVVYGGLDAVLNVDYFSRNSVTRADYTPTYRSASGAVATLGTMVCLYGGGAGDRASWTVTANYFIGWAGNGAWQNYTRNFPAGTYAVYAALSTGDGNDESGSMDLVTSGSTTTTQTLVPLGTFLAPTSGGWGVNVLIPMKDLSGAVATVNLGGSQTVRFNSGAGDEDYFLFVPGATPVAASIVTPPANQTVATGADATFTVVATGTGPLTYQWNFGGPLSGQTNATLVITNAQANNAGDYTVTVTGGTGASVTSPIAALAVGGDRPRITNVRQNADKSITIEWTGGGVLQVATSLTAPIQWQNAPGAATSPYTFTPDPGAPVLFGRIIVNQ